jgi:mRNA interferase MazF
MVLPLSGDLRAAPLVHITVEPPPATGLTKRSQMTIDKAVTVQRTKIGHRIGSVDLGTMRAVDAALTGFLDLN